MTFPLTVKVQSGDGTQVFASESVNISKSAIEIRGDGAMVASFMAQSAYPHFCELGFKLPGCQEEVVVECQLTTHRRLSQHCYQLIFLFGEYVSGSQEALTHFLEDQQDQVLSHG